VNGIDHITRPTHVVDMQTTIAQHHFLPAPFQDDPIWAALEAGLDQLGRKADSSIDLPAAMYFMAAMLEKQLSAFWVIDQNASLCQHTQAGQVDLFNLFCGNDGKHQTFGSKNFSG
jgi:hypothetical protein